MFCQLCQKPQPVVLNGEEHFEVTTCIRDINDQHHEQNNLALCPNHAAMYKNGCPSDIHSLIVSCERQSIPLNLAGNQVELYFTQQHLTDLRTVLNEVTSPELNEEM